MLHKMEEEYYTILGFIGQSRTSTNANTPSMDHDNVDELGKSLEGLGIRRGKAGSQGGRMNIEK